MWRPSPPAAYCYVLGLYLGDGHIVTRGRGATLRITLDALYQKIIEEAVCALKRVFPGTPVQTYAWGEARSEILQVSHPGIRPAFPQHGPGRKHTRRILLSGWQRDLTTRYPHALLRGLIHSDGSRTINRFRTRLPSGRVTEYAYPRYFFTNVSSDIRAIFCEHCELLGIRWTQSNARNISVSNRPSVAILDRIVGPKT
jgi:hypothetical protein